MEARMNQGLTPLHRAVIMGMRDCVRLVIAIFGHNFTSSSIVVPGGFWSMEWMLMPEMSLGRLLCIGQDIITTEEFLL